MHPDDLSALTQRIEAALAESASELGTDTPGPSVEYAVPLELIGAHCVNHECTRQALTDPAVQRLGGREHTVAIVDGPEPDHQQLILISVAGTDPAAPRPVWTSDRPEEEGSPKPGKVYPDSNPAPLRASPQMGPLAVDEPYQRVQARGNPQNSVLSTADSGMPEGEQSRGAGYDRDEANGGHGA